MPAARGSKDISKKGGSVHQGVATRHPLRSLAMYAIAALSILVLLGSATAFSPPSTMLLRSMTAFGPRGHLTLHSSNLASTPRAGSRRSKIAQRQGVVMMAKKKMSAAQLAALEALSKFEAGAVEAPAGAVVIPEIVSMKKEKKQKKPKEGKGKKEEESSVELSEQEMEEEETKVALAALQGKKDKKKDQKMGGDEEEDAVIAPVANQKKKEGKAPSVAPMDVEGAFTGADESDLDDLIGGKSKKDKKKGKAEVSQEAAPVKGGGDFDISDLFEESDSGRPGKGKKKGSKDKGKEAKQDEKQAVKAVKQETTEATEEAVADPNAETLETKIKKSRPPPRVRIDTGAQPGFVSVRLEDIRVIFKNQEEFVDELVPSRTLKEELQSVFVEEAKIMEELDNFDKVLEKCKDDVAEMQKQLDRMQDLQQRADSMQVTMLQSKVEKIMDLMGFIPEDGEALVASFSGGWKMRIGLGKILLTEPNLLLLDEPTNHLDLESIEWMENFLINQKIPMVIVSHDREFLDRVCNKIVDVDGGQTATYENCNYSRFLKQKKERRDAWQSAYDAQMKRVKAEKDWINRFKVGAMAAQAASRQKKLEKQMESDTWVQKPPTPGKPLKFRFPPAPRVGDGYAIMTANDIQHGYNGQVLFDDVNMAVEKGDRIAMLGPNGCGKSTFLRLVVGKEKANQGSIKLGGENIVVSYFEQNQADVLDLDKTVLETMKHAADGRIEYEEIRALLGQFLFKGDSVDKKIRQLSGGEKARVSLCTMMLSPANLLVLDEPTNHLDIPAKEMLEEALQNFDGTLLVISHDRYFVSQVANVIAAFEDKKLVRYNGDYRFYMDKNEEWKEKVEARYVDGVEGIRNLPEIKMTDELDKRKKNFGGSGVTSGDKAKGVKNAKRQGEM